MSLCVEMCVCAIVSIVDLPPQFQNMIFLMQAHKDHKKVKGVGKIWNASRICVSSLRRGHANLLCIVPILVYVEQVNDERAPNLLFIPHFSS